jgi:hypothetical protein
MDTMPALNETVYTAEELAKLKKLHPSTIRKMFLDEPGVLRIGHAGLRHRKQHFTIRIPASVAERVFGDMTVKA